MRFAALIYKITHFTLYIRYFNIYFQRTRFSECHCQGEACRAAGEHGGHQRGADG